MRGSSREPLNRDVLETFARAIEGLRHGADLIYLGGFHDNLEMLSQVRTDENGIGWIDASGPELWGSHGYVVTSGGASNLLRDAFPIRCPVDKYMIWHNAIPGKIRSCAFVPEIVHQNDIFSSTVETTHRGRHQLVEGSPDYVRIRDGRVFPA